ncbi:hypothetical protein K466DRAFT_588188 [Polyporus arcularius HHB13444]|uniref:Uncharacterized protein n=1 Tax=Polyporus arcularius HHB13444 TaxID=1314778 RepID=A0A5C3PAU4_9APHY|nr:hypothetical protein K466DRAFT_588188 [Polyporus arcularius HHB13444]
MGHPGLTSLAAVGIVAGVALVTKRCQGPQKRPQYEQHGHKVAPESHACGNLVLASALLDRVDLELDCWATSSRQSIWRMLRHELKTGEHLLVVSYYYVVVVLWDGLSYRA